MTEVNAHDGQHEQEDMVPGPSIPVLLVCVADVIMAGGAPVPVLVEVSARTGMWVSLATHTELRAWAQVVGLTVLPRHSQPYVDGDGVLCRLTIVSGRWRDADVTLHCREPVDAVAALREGGEVDR